MKKFSVLFVAALCLLALPSQSDAGVIISPRLALPTGDFADVVSTGFGGAVAIDKEVKGKPGRAGLLFLTFGEDVGSATAIGAFAGYRYMFGSDDLRLYGKVRHQSDADQHRNRGFRHQG